MLQSFHFDPFMDVLPGDGQQAEELRRRNFQTHVAACVDMKGMTGRNQDAIKKNQATLDTIVRNQEEILALLKKK